MQEIIESFYLETDEECGALKGNDAWTVIHATWGPCYANQVAHLRRLAKVPTKVTDDALVFDDYNLYLNFSDGIPYPVNRTTTQIRTAMKWIDDHRDKKQLVHCGMATSRSPSIVLIYLARKGLISSTSCEDAKNDFMRFYDTYRPGSHITSYLTQNWSVLMAENFLSDEP